MTWYAGDNSTNNGTFGWLFFLPPDVTVGITGVSATTNVGAVTVSIVNPDVTVAVTGLPVTGAVGSVSLTGL
jgi:hypothetical protein